MKTIIPGKLIPALLSVCLFLLSSQLLAAAVKKPTVEDFGTLPSISKMRMSPSGNLIAFIKTEGDVDNILVYSLKDKKVVDGAKLGELTAYDLYFISDSRLIINAGRVRRVLGYRGAFEVGSAYILDLKSGDIRQLLIPGKGIYLGQSGLGDIVGLTKDAKYAFMPAYTGNDFYHDPAPEYSLMKVNLMKTRKPRVEIRGEHESYDYFVTKDGERLAELRYNDRNDRHEVFSYLSGERKTIYSEEEHIRTFSAVGLTPEQDALVIKSSSIKYDRDIVRTMSLKDGSISEPIFVRDDADVYSLYSDVHRIVYGVIYSGLNPSYEFFDKKLNDRVNKVVQELEGTSVWLQDWSEDKSKLVIFAEGSYSAGDFYLINEDNSRLFLATSRPEIAPEAVNPIGKVTFKARDGLSIPTILTIPQQHLESMKNLPAIMMPHGGPAHYDSIGFDWMAQAMASQGYLVIQPQFRGSTGFGLSHKLAGRGEWGKKMQDDLTDAVKFFENKGMIDPNRVCIVGGSYGGYAALAGATFTPDLYKCVVSLNGVSDIWRMLKDEKSDHGKDSWVLSYWKTQWAGEDSHDKDFLRSISPSEHVDKVKAPILLIHGENDKVVSVKQSKIMYKALKKAEKPVEFIELDGEDHYLSQRDTRIAALNAMIEFVNAQLAVNKSNGASTASKDVEATVPGE